MKRTFRLATVQRLRAARLDDATLALALARQAVAAAATHRDTLAAELTGCVAGPAATGAQLEGAQARRVVLGEQVEAAAGQVAAARDRAGAAVSAWTAARADLRAVETLHERHREAVRAQDTRGEQRELDDLAATPRRVAGGEHR